MVVKFFFQLVRTATPPIDLLFSLLQTIKNNEIKYVNSFINLYKLIAQTRDIKFGKGEYMLAYMQIYVWYFFYPDLAMTALKYFVCGKSPYGSWKDIKLFCSYIKKNTKNENHPLINYACSLMLYQLSLDHISSDVSLAGKWAPRQKSKHKWLFEKMAFLYYQNYFIYTNPKSIVFAKKKAKMHFRQLLSGLNRKLQTTQVLMANKQPINPKNLTSLTIHKNRHALACCIKTQTKLPGKKCQPYQLVKAALNSTNMENIINMQWIDNSLINLEFHNVIPVLDVSILSLSNNCIPLYNAIALGIRISEKNKGVFKNRLLIFSSYPTWVALNANFSFVRKVKEIYKYIVPLPADAVQFSESFNIILKSLTNNQLSCDEVSKLRFVILSGSQVVKNIYNYIEQMFLHAGIITIGKPYPPPHFIFWNLLKSNHFPCKSTQKNVTFLSGYNSTLLNLLSYNKNKTKYTQTPCQILTHILSHNIYNVMGYAAISSLYKNYINI